MSPFIRFREIAQRIFSLALPMSGSQLINVASGFLCMGMLAQLGNQTLAASALIFSTQMTIMVTGMSLIFSLSVLVGHAYGAKNYLGIGSFVQQAWVLGALISVPIIFLFWHIDSILVYFGQEPAMANIVQQYFHAYVFAVIPGFISTCNQQFGYGIHKKTLIVSTSFMSVTVLLVTAYVLIFGKLGMPALGVAGLGYAMAAQYTFFCVFTLLFFYYEKSFKRFELFRFRIHKEWEQMAQVFKIGWPISLQMGGEMLTFLVDAIMVGWLGTVALSAFQVVNQYTFLVVIPIFSLSQACGILVGQARGGKQFHDIKPLGYMSILLVLLMTSVIALIFLFFPKFLAEFYVNVHDPINQPIVAIIVVLFAIVAFTQLADGMRNVLIGLLRGLFDTKFPMIVGLVTIWLGVLLSYVLAFPLHFGIVGIALGSLLGLTSGAVILLLRWRVLSKQWDGHNEMPIEKKIPNK